MPAMFFPALAGETPPVLRWPASAGTPQAESAAMSSPMQWADFAVCNICPDEWNVDFAGPVFAAGPVFDDRYVDTLTLGATIAGNTPYPIRTTGHVYAGTGGYLGSLDLRYFGSRMPSELHFDVRCHSIPGSARLLIAFQVGGGGGPRVPRPPLITSVSICVRLSGGQ